MTGLIIKLIVCPLTLILASYLLPGISYPYLYQPVVVGVILAFAAHLMELMLLRKSNFWKSNIIDFLAAFAIVFLSRYIFHDAEITLVGALLTSLLLGITEYAQHLYLLRSGKARRI